MANYDVFLPEERKCCGWPMLSKGLIEDARANARHNVSLLAQFARRAILIVGCEPSCLLTIRDDYPDLVFGEDARLVAGQTRAFEELIAEHVHPGDLRLRENDVRILVHGDCHQEILVGLGAARKALGLLPGASVEEIPSGCCGMAGSFGYEQEHYALSLEIGELTLLPAVRAAAPDVEIVAAGISCRQQIMHSTGRVARHPAEVLYEAYLGGTGHADPA